MFFNVTILCELYLFFFLTDIGIDTAIKVTCILLSLEYHKFAAKLIISSGIDLFIDPVYDAGTDFRGARNEHG